MIAAGGDTNNDGSASRPAPGDWSRIAFSNSSVNSLLDHVVVRYGGSGGNGSISVDGSAPTIRNSQIVRGSSYGIRLTNVAMPSITDSLIADNNSDGIHMTTSSAPTLTNNGFVNNTGYAVRMDASCAPTMGGSSASSNVYNGVGVNGAVPANTTWAVDLPYVIDGGMTVNTGVVLTLPAGIIVKFRSGNLIVNGTLRANGTDASRIVFTSFSDTSASAAGSILGRASAASLEAIAAPGDWGRIEFASTSSASTLNYVVVRYGGRLGWRLWQRLSQRRGAFHQQCHHLRQQRAWAVRHRRQSDHHGQHVHRERQRRHLCDEPGQPDHPKQPDLRQRTVRREQRLRGRDD